MQKTGALVAQSAERREQSISALLHFDLSFGPVDGIALARSSLVRQ